MRTILLTNDDGYKSPGLKMLTRTLKKISRLIVIAPEQPRSAAGLSVTVHKPVRINKLRSSRNFRLYTVTGTTGDCVIIGLYNILSQPPNLVVSGINIGENISLLEFFMSGTIAGAILGALHGIPSIAFSKREMSRDVLHVEEYKKGYEDAAKCAKIIVSYILDEGLPQGIDLLNVNFPVKINKNTQVKVTRLASLSFKSKVIVRRDPRGRPYYWIWGDKLTSFPEGTDAYEVINKKNISITPISLINLSPRTETDIFKRMEEYLNDSLYNIVK